MTTHHDPVHHATKTNPLVQSIGYELALPVPDPSVSGVTISAADWQFCYDVAKPALKVVVRAQLTATTPPPPLPHGTPKHGSAPDPAIPGLSTIVLLEASASNDDLNAIIAWLGTFKGALMAVQNKKDLDKSRK